MATFGPYILDVQKRIPLVVPLSQNDKGNSLVFALYSGSAQYTMTTGSVTLSGRKPSGKVFSYTGTRSGNLATFTIDEQMTAEAGQVLCEVAHSASGTRKGSANFIIDCERDPLTDGDVSETDLSVMQEAIAAADELRNGLDVLDGAFTMRGTLPSGSLDNATAPGTYTISGSNSYSDLPYGVTYGTLTVLKGTEGGFITQLLARGSTAGGNLYSRQYQNGAWGSWSAYNTSRQERFEYNGISCTLTRVGQLVDVVIAGTATNEMNIGNSYVALCTVPSWATPAIQFVAYHTISAGRTAQIYIRPADIRIGYSSAMNGSGGSASYSIPAGAVVRAHTSYVTNAAW